MIRNRIVSIAYAAVLLAHAAGGAAAEEVDLKGWYTEASSPQCTGQACVCLTFPPLVSPVPMVVSAMPDFARPEVTVAMSREGKPLQCFQDRNAAAVQDGRVRLLLNVMLYRNKNGGLPTPVLIRSEVSESTKKIVKIYIEPVP